MISLKMNPWQKVRQRSGWKHGGLAEWTEDGTAYLSVIFSWNLPQAYQRAVWLKALGYHVKVGGPAVIFNPGYLADVAEVGSDYPDAVVWHNPNATFTSRGCVRRCAFCLVPKTEGGLAELDTWPVRRIICDNNLLACSQVHFDRVMDSLKPLNDIDIQGLDARLLTKHHAERLAELDLHCVRLAWDNTRFECQVTASIQKLRSAGIPKSRVRCYVLIGYNDTPEDALHRLETLRALGVWPNPMRYQALDAMWRNQHVGSDWTDGELKRYMRYWSNLRFTSAIPFDEFRAGQ